METRYVIFLICESILLSMLVIGLAGIYKDKRRANNESIYTGDLSKWT